MNYLDFLKTLHQRLGPRHYLEIGVRWGDSLGVAQCHSVGIDPAFSIKQEVHGSVDLFRTTSDEYFARAEPLAPTGGEPFDLTFIDGMHLFEFALRDFINSERHSRHSGVIVFDDILPRTVEEANRSRRTKAWTGDVFPIIAVLEKYRPDLLMLSVDTQPTGLLLVMGLDPTSTALRDNYGDIIREFRKPDPQRVPQELLDRTFVQQANRFLDSPLLDIVAAAQDDREPDRLSADLRAAAVAHLGAAYAG